MSEVQALETWVRTTIAVLLDPSDRSEIRTFQVGSRYVVVVATDNPGGLIGKHGSTIEAIRTLMTKVSGRLRMTFDIDVIERR